MNEHNCIITKIVVPGWSEKNPPTTWFHHKCKDCENYDIWDPVTEQWISSMYRLNVQCNMRAELAAKKGNE